MSSEVENALQNLFDAARKYGKAVKESGGYYTIICDTISVLCMKHSLDAYHNATLFPKSLTLGELKPGDKFKINLYPQIYTVVGPHPNTKSFVVVLNEHGDGLVFDSYSNVVRVE